MDSSLITLTADYVVGIVKGYLGLYFEVVDSDHSFNELTWLTSGNLRLPLWLGVHPADRKFFSFQITSELTVLGVKLAACYRIENDNTISIDETTVRDALEFAVRQANQVDIRGSAEHVRLMTFELPNQTVDENDELIGAIATRMSGFVIGLPCFYGRLTDGSVFSSAEDHQGIARYAQVTLRSSMRTCEIVERLSGLIEFPTEIAIGAKSMAWCKADKKRLVYRTRHFA